MNAPLVEAMAGVAVAWFTYVLVTTAKRADEHFRVSERAYIQMSHRRGIEFIGGEKITVKMQVRNWGKTPGRVTDQRLGPILKATKNAKLTGPPDYSALKETTAPEAFLIPTGLYNWSVGFEFSEVGAAEAIKDGEATLFLIGYVDYKDEFGGRYRAGYARKYATNPEDSGDPNNLSFVPSKGFNYDRMRKPGEGNDWDD